MKRLAIAAAAFAATGSFAFAGGLDRSGQSIAVAFEKGDYIQLSYGSVDPKVSGTYTGGAVSGDIAPRYGQVALGYRNQLTDNIAIALIYDQPWGAHSSYPASGTFAALRGTRAEVTSQAITMMGLYRTDENITVYGGLKSTTIEMTAALPAAGNLNYTITGSSARATGYLVGVAYEIPEIALRAALTYHSSSTFNVPTSETSVLTTGSPPATSSTRVEMPEAINLDFQTGIAADTLLMAGVRVVNWTQTVIAPNHYSTALGRGALLSYTTDAYTWSLGLGRRFSENLSGSVMLGHEKAKGGTASDLAPTDGYNSISFGLSYQMEAVKISGGVRYVQVGDATSAGTFRDNSALGLGLSIGYSF